MQLVNKTIVLTGASDGIGREIALKLAKAKAHLALVARDPQKLASVHNDCLKAGAHIVEIFPTDLRDPVEVKKLAERILAKFAEIHILINDAGIWQKRGELEEIEDQAICDIVATNLTGMVILTKYLLPILRKQAEAAILNVSSRSGVTAQPGQTVYSASKWGVTGFTEVLKVDLANTNIKVAGVYQAGVQTGLHRKTGEVIPDDKYQKFIPPAELAEAIVFMLGRPNNAWIHDLRIGG